MKWFMAAKKADFNQQAIQYGISPIMARIIRNRDIIEDDKIKDFLECRMDQIPSPFLLKDMDMAVRILEDSIQQNKKIRVIGDYDIDGVSATYILAKGLKLCGAKVDYAIPHRINDGYGINENLIREAYEQGVQTLITCDNGISAKTALEYAKSLGLTVVVTDHHEVPYEEVEQIRYEILPPADALVDPKQEDCTYPFKGICGALVAYKLISVLAQHYEISLPQDCMEMAAFATIGDVMELKEENRTLVKWGLKSMEKTSNMGLKALMDVTGISGKPLSPYHIGFVLGPCLNATGRLDTAEKAIRLLESETYEEAVLLASDLKDLNDSRKELTRIAVEEAIEQVEGTDCRETFVLVIFLPDCHESLAGIVAGRIREKYLKPTFVLTRTEEGLKGSGRGIEAYHMYEEMIKIKHIFTKFGGHKLAAGLSMKEENLELFRKEINQNCTLTEEDLYEKILIDMILPFSYVTEDLIEELKIGEPYGTGNPKPLFAQKNVRFISGRIMGKNGTAAKYIVTDESEKRMELIYFRGVDQFHQDIETHYGREALQNMLEARNNPICLNIAYYPGLNEFQNSRSIQLTMQHYQFA